MRLPPNIGSKNVDEPLVYYRIRPASITRQALKQEILLDACKTVVQENSQALFGINSVEMSLLLQKRHPEPVRALKAMANHLRETQPGEANPYATDSFLKVAGYVLAAVPPPGLGS